MFDTTTQAAVFHTEPLITIPNEPWRPEPHEPGGEEWARTRTPDGVRRLLPLDQFTRELAVSDAERAQIAAYGPIPPGRYGGVWADAYEFALEAAAALASQQWDAVFASGHVMAATYRIADDTLAQAAWDALRGAPLEWRDEPGALDPTAFDDLWAEHMIEIDQRDEEQHADAALQGETSWAPHDPAKYLDPDAPGDPAPSILRRADGHALLYAGAVNALYGEPESLKSWIAQVAVAEVLRSGGSAVYLDFEASGRQVFGRLRQLGVSDAALRDRFAYIRPDEPLGGPQREDLQRALIALQPEFAIIDGITDAMALLGFDLNDNKDYATFNRLLAKPIADAGVCVCLVDHVVKAKDNRGAYALGAQHKRAAISGAAYTAHKTTEFGRGRTGTVELHVSKDRAGHVSGIAVGAQRRVADITFTSHGLEDDAQITVRVDSPDGQDGGAFRPTNLMEKVSRALEDAPDGLGSNELRAAVGAKREYVEQAVSALLREEYLRRTPEARGKLVHRSLRPYREADDPLCSAMSL